MGVGGRFCGYVELNVYPTFYFECEINAESKVLFGTYKTLF